MNRQLHGIYRRPMGDILPGSPEAVTNFSGVGLTDDSNVGVRYPSIKNRMPQAAALAWMGVKEWTITATINGHTFSLNGALATGNHVVATGDGETSRTSKDWSLPDLHRGRVPGESWLPITSGSLAREVGEIFEDEYSYTDSIQFSLTHGLFGWHQNTGEWTQAFSVLARRQSTVGFGFVSGGQSYQGTHQAPYYFGGSYADGSTEPASVVGEPVTIEPAVIGTLVDGEDLSLSWSFTMEPASYFSTWF